MKSKKLLIIGSVLPGVFVSVIFMQSAALFAKTEPAKDAAAPQGNPAPRSIGSDTNQDGTPDKWEYYEEGVLVKIEADSNFDGKVDEWGVIESGRIVRVEKDSDYDGKVDKWVNY